MFAKARTPERSKGGQSSEVIVNKYYFKIMQLFFPLVNISKSFLFHPLYISCLKRHSWGQMSDAISGKVKETSSVEQTLDGNLGVRLSRSSQKQDFGRKMFALLFSFHRIYVARLENSDISWNHLRFYFILSLVG